MRKLSGKEIRSTWIKFFESKGHKYLPGVSLIPEGDKSLLWVNAGVTGLKKYFDGSEIPPCRRIVNVQKSIRTNDIENVGHTARHHTFFEMLGNFSIGDYFRKEVIAWATEILTSKEYFDIPFEKLYMTYNPSDKESFEFWKQNGVDPTHLIPLEGNYWQIGEGPCGPNTEVFFDRGEEFDPEHLGVKLLQDEIENDRYIEIWGIVFSQFNAEKGVERKDYKELPSKNIDTGAGLERLACVLQGTPTNFETDLFMPIINATEKISGVKYEGDNRQCFKVIADHCRTLTFACSDGAYFSNEGRGYVLRRIIRRAMRYGQKLGINKPFMYDLVNVVASEYNDFYPNLKKMAPTVIKMIKGEEEKFLRTLVQGEAMLQDFIKKTGKGNTLDGSIIFKLYDTYGFPNELTKEICLEAGVNPDMKGFEKAMEEQKERARSARGDIESFHKQSKDLLEFNEPSMFFYEDVTIRAKVIGLFADGVKVSSIDDEGDVILDSTVFYAESGGQICDIGDIFNDDFSAKVTNVTKAPGGQHLHHIHVEFGTLKIGDGLILRIDVTRRALTARNHSATHLLHAALSKVLGHHVDQKGSFVCDEYMRFDYNSLEKPTPEQLNEIEMIVNNRISRSIKQETKILPIEEAKKLGAEMEFSEKYGDTVRVVTFGDFSKEFCGGTHVSNSAEIGLFTIEEESAVSSGVRRIQGRSSYGAYWLLANKKAILSNIEGEVGGAIDSVALSRVKSLNEKIEASKKTISALEDKIAYYRAKNLADSFEDIGGIKFLASRFENTSRDNLMKIADSLKTIHQDFLLVLSSSGEKGSIVIFAGGIGLSKIGAGVAMKELCSKLGGNGGGRPEMASGSASDFSKWDLAVASLKEKING